MESISLINSNTAKNGYKEEELVCLDLNSNIQLRQSFIEYLGNDYDECVRVNGTHKCDIQSKDNTLTGQIKKYKKGQFQQLDRHWLDDLAKHIPELNDETISMFRGMCEIELLENGTHVDKNKPVRKLCTSNYSQTQLDNFVLTLNQYKRKILYYAFLGTNPDIVPTYLFGVEYVNDSRNKIVLMKIQDIIDYLETLDFKISKRKTVVTLGDDSILSMQRKGGDGGKKGSNQLQVKLIVSKLLDKIQNLQYTF